MPQCIVFTVARQIDRKNCVPPRKRFHILTPAERSAQQSMQQQKGAARSSAEIVDLRSVNFHDAFLYLHGYFRDNHFSIWGTQIECYRLCYL